MNTPPESPQTETAVQAAAEGNMVTVGLVTRVISWLIDVLLINLVATITGVFVALILDLFPITKGLKPLLAGVAGAAYILWAAAYFVAFWSMTGQSPGARVMQVRVVTPEGDRVKPTRALVRWVGMNLGLLPLPWGYVPIPFKRLGFPDWLAHTRVIENPQLSLAEARQAKLRSARNNGPTTAPRAIEQMTIEQMTDDQ